MTGFSRGMLAATTALWLCSAGAAAAQQLDTPDQSASEVVVTAQKREQKLLDVPAAISVVGSARLEEFKASQLTDIAAYVPGFQVDTAGGPGRTTVSLRGIAPLGASATISTYIDEAPVGSSSFYARSAGFTADLLPYDIERVEVLKGPQGTLYGASSIGGLIKYVTKAPDLNAFEARAGTDVFTIADSGGAGYSGRVAINLPIVTDKLAIRGSYAYQHTPGYIDNVVTGAKDVNKFTQQSARLSVLWKPTETLSVKLAGMWQSIDADNNAVAIATLPAGYLNPADPRAQMQVPPGVATPIGNGYAQTYALPERFKQDLFYFTATADLDLGFANLISASSYSRTKTRQLNDLSDVLGVLFPLFGLPAGNSSFELTLDLKKFTQELRLGSSGESAFKWMLGGFYTHEDSGNRQVMLAYDRNNVPIPGVNPFTVAALPTTYQEYAAFGQLSYTFADVFELSGGLRYAHNDQKFTQITNGALFPPAAPAHGASSADVVTWSASARYKLGQRASLYARVATGYRPGGPNISFPGVPSSVGADRLTNYEIGIKADVLGGAATLETAVFMMDWDKIQLSDSIGPITFSRNAGSARAKGIELAATVRPARGFGVGLNAAYTDARLTSDAASVGGVNGARLPLVPKFSSSVTLDYATRIGGDWTASAGTAFRFVSDRYSLVSSALQTVKSPDYAALDANVALSNDRWTVRLFAKNLTDSRGILSSGMMINSFLARTYVTQVPIQPRTVGLALDVKF